MSVTFSLAILNFWGRLSESLAFPLLVLLGSAVWFLGGYWDFKRGDDKGYFWAGIGVFMLVVYSLTEVFSKMWVGLVLTAAGATLEIWHMNRWRR